MEYKGVVNMGDIVNEVRKHRINMIVKLLETEIEGLKKQGYEVEFGKIGQKSTYALIKNKEGEEYVGYTYVANLNNSDPDYGNYKALLQATARKSFEEDKVKSK